MPEERAWYYAIHGMPNRRGTKGCVLGVRSDVIDDQDGVRS